MYKRVEVEGYQSLRKVSVDLGKFTVITGPSNNGKSAMIRALTAMAFNQTGSDFIHKDMSKCTVTVTLDDNEGVERTVTWMKGKTSGYSVDDGKPTAQVYMKLGGNVPEEVSSILGIQKLEVDNVKLTPQIADQFDAPFLMDESGTKAARVVAKMTRLDVVLTALSNCLKDIKKIKAELTRTDLNIKDKEDKLKQFDDLVSRLDEFKKVEEDVRDYESLNKELLSLWSVCYTFAYEKQEYSKPVVDLKEVNEFIELVQQIEELQETVNEYYALYLAIDTTHTKRVSILKRIKEVEQELESYKSICPTCGQVIES